jgi:hypothetical protein
MAYDMKNVFYLDTRATIASGTAGATTAQLDLSAYIDPIARGRQKGTGLAIYKVHWAASPSSTNGEAFAVAEAGVFRGGLVAGAGLGDNATGVVTPTGVQQPGVTNALTVSGFDFYGPTSIAAKNSVGMYIKYVDPSEKVPYVVVRDNVCIVIEQQVNMTAAATVGCRIECAIITLDQNTLNQLLRTQTV